MKKLLAFMLLALPLGAGGVFTGAGDISWLKSALAVKKVSGYTILESEVSSVHGHKYWSYKVRVLDATNILKNLNIERMGKLRNETDISNARKLLPLALKDAKPIYYLSRKFHQYYDDIFIILPPESKEPVMFIVFSAESFSLTK